MCLPFSCGGSDKGDEYGPHHDPSSVHQPFRPRPPQPPPPPSAASTMMYVPPSPDEEDNDQPSYKPPSAMKEGAAALGHHGANMMPAAAGSEGWNGGARVAPPQGYVAEVNKNGGGRMTAFGYSDDDVAASVDGVVRGRESAAGRIAVASTTPATQGFNNKHRDLAAAKQAPHQRTHGHGHGSSAAASHPSEAADNMKAPLQVLPMARRGPQGY